MSPKEINQTSIVEYLANIGIYPARTYNGYSMYYSPLRPHEKSPSMKVSSSNLWIDFGNNNDGGTLIDLILKLNPGFTISQILRDYNNGIFSFQQPVSSIEREIKKENHISIKKIQELQNPILIKYLIGRRLNIACCKKYCMEMYYEVNNKRYFGVSFKNISGGYEVRNKYAKLCLGKKDITRIENGFNSCVVFESWSDFIAFLTLYPKVESSNDFLILNSTMMLPRIDSQINNYKKIFTALDNDESGKSATKACMVKFPEKVVPLNHLYLNFKDVNEYLKHKSLV